MPIKPAEVKLQPLRQLPEGKIRLEAELIEATMMALRAYLKHPNKDREIGDCGRSIEQCGRRIFELAKKGAQQ